MDCGKAARWNHNETESGMGVVDCLFCSGAGIPRRWRRLAGSEISEGVRDVTNLRLESDEQDSQCPACKSSLWVIPCRNVAKRADQTACRERKLSSGISLALYASKRERE